MAYQRTRTGGLDRYVRDQGYWRERKTPEQIEAEKAAAIARVAAQPAPSFERRAHPVIETPARKCYRVIRRFLSQGHMELEDIGACGTFGQALAISTTERWRAQVLDPNGKVVSDNLQDMERRA